MSDTTDAISLHVTQSVNSYCSCGFSIQNDLLFCSDEISITLRGSIDNNLLPYLQGWVAKTTVINVLGSPLAVDHSCPVQIKSFSDVGCATYATSPTKSPVEERLANAVATAAGATVSTIVGIICFTVIVVVVMLVVVQLKKRSAPTPAVRFDNKLANTSSTKRMGGGKEGGGEDGCGEGEEQKGGVYGEGKGNEGVVARVGTGEEGVIII